MAPTNDRTVVSTSQRQSREQMSLQKRSRLGNYVKRSGRHYKSALRDFKTSQKAADFVTKVFSKTLKLYKAQQTSLQKCFPRLQNHAHRCRRPYKSALRDFKTMQTAADVPIKDLPETWQLYKTQQTSLQKCSPRLRNHANRCGRPYNKSPEILQSCKTRQTSLR